MNIRFLRRAGISGPEAVTVVGVKSFLGFLAQSSLLVVLLVVAGSSGVGAAPRLPGTVLIAAAAVVLAAGLGAAVPAGRRLVRRRLWPALRQAMASLHQLVERPAQALLAVAGSFLVLACQILALGASTQAFHAHLPVATLGLVVLGASAAASAVPSPGGLGPAEAAYTAGLVIAGLDASTAIAAVLLFRLATYWLPLVPGGISFWVLRVRRRI